MLPIVRTIPLVQEIKQRLACLWMPAATEMIINEILFNPKAASIDYVEFYNHSNKIFDANKLYIANRNSSGAISSIRLISSTPYYIFPGDYIVVTEDADQSCAELPGTKP